MAESLLHAALEMTPPPGDRGILALAGPPAAGKSTLARRLIAALEARLGDGVAAYVPLDGFHLSNAQLDRMQARDRKGAPFTFDLHGYLALLRRLREDMTAPIYVPDYDRALHEPVAARHVVWPHARLVVTEGNYLAGAGPGWRDVADLADATWFVDVPAETQQRRLAVRHSEGGRGDAEARRRTADNDLPNSRQVRRERRDDVRIVQPQSFP